MSHSLKEIAMSYIEDRYGDVNKLPKDQIEALLDAFYVGCGHVMGSTIDTVSKIMDTLKSTPKESRTEIASVLVDKLLIPKLVAMDNELKPNLKRILEAAGVPHD